MKKRYIVLRYKQFSREPIFYVGSNGNLSGGRYDTSKFNSVKFDTETEANSMVENELNYIKENDLTPSLFQIEPVYF